MDSHVDWLSFTRKTKIEPRTAMELYKDARQKLREVGKNVEELYYDGQGFEPVGGRAPYRVAIARDDSGSRIHGASHTETILYELSGRGCEPLRESIFAQSVLGCVHDSVTRLDVAVDIITPTGPSDFANAREHDRFRSISFIRSATGETVYVGSPKSDRFCRVYRYNPPHPRSEILRVEFVSRRGLARAAALQLSQEANWAEYIGKLGNTYGFIHRCWEPGSKTSERLSAPIVEKKDADTVHWLYAQVVPAVRRLMKTGALDMTEWLEYVYSDRDSPL